MNNINILGRLTATPELKTTQNGKSVTSFTVAVDRGYGENKTTDFIPCVAWNGIAEVISKYFFKGSKIALSGALTTPKYTDKDGNNKTKFEVIVEGFDFIENKKDENQITTDEMDNLDTQNEDLF